MRYARSLTRDDAAAEDLVQQTLVRAIERSDSFRRDAALEPWLMALLHNLFVDGTRRVARERRAMDGLEGATPAGASLLPQEQQLYLDQIASRFDALPEEQRAVLHLVAIEGRTYAEVAGTLNLPIGTVMSRLSRARAALRDAALDRAADPKLRIIGGTDAG
ncbi:RNA polymerase sigma-70 factor, ECF subfamily [Sphingomonas jatrophae]|uniref:RNA polymerase sigma-70 factor, ECF subfamily n=1 Tax=Sphingomonas jatrophae TaxID=1166337 RepID=A0A1I6KZU0_9SPHN|nr:RNA polymerase sigma-70 factor, ECF subfamily [Sphingomonas jatrophae]